MALNKVTCTHPYEHNLGKGTGNGNQHRNRAHTTFTGQPLKKGCQSRPNGLVSWV